MLEGGDIGQTAKVPLKVESIADEKLVIHLEAPVFERQFDEPELRTVPAENRSPPSEVCDLPVPDTGS